MAVQTVSFAAQVNDFVRQTQRRMEAVFRESAQRVITEMQTPVAQGGNMPVDTGFLRASLRITKDAPLPMGAGRPDDAKTYAYNPTAASLVLAGAGIGDTLFASYTANYAGFVHYGREGRPGRQWVTMAAQRWPTIVAQVSAELQGRVEARQAPGGR
ncbi:MULTISPECIES: HK97 gp10 family phage protein [Methylorubrum]|uniref:HK97 gp10 family phage protein n=1 Tax=Methylorubrum TaxID=2282523 RepID=UPI00209CB37E|nr:MULTISPECIES: HK97 gp10 family phage protein [Methylorubrum]MCP1550710.1 hypothetical protein [Methylorubrum zatmanii]MCP1552677.1 hypothetical protein [Methylorubrum extorquens]MCP1581013.1 hypothetical protein [Methylorubrum extorquens]